MDGGAWWATVHGVAKSRTRLNDFTFAFHSLALEREVATHSSVLAWRIPWMGEPGRLLSMGSHRVGHDWSILAAAAAVLKLTLVTGADWLIKCCPCRDCSSGELEFLVWSEESGGVRELAGVWKAWFPPTPPPREMREVRRGFFRMLEFFDPSG